MSGARTALLVSLTGHKRRVRVAERSAPKGYVWVYVGADIIPTLVTRDRLVFTRERKH